MQKQPLTEDKTASSSTKSPPLTDHVRKIVQRALPNVSEIEDATINLITQCMMELASSLAFEAISVACSEGRTRIEGADLLDALRGYGFENYIKPMDMYLDAYHIHADTCLACKGPPSKSAESKEAGVTTRTLPKKDWGAKEPIPRKVTAPKAKKPTVRVDWSDPAFFARVRRQAEKVMTEALTHPNPDLLLNKFASEIKFPFRQIQEMFYEFKKNRPESNGGHAVASSSNNVPAGMQVNVGVPRPLMPQQQQQQHLPVVYTPMIAGRLGVNVNGVLLPQSNVRWPPVQPPRPPPSPHQPQIGNPGWVNGNPSSNK